MTVIQPVAAAQCAADQLAIFRRAATMLASTLDLEQTLANAIGAFLPALGDFGFFDAVIDGEVRRTARAHEDPATEALLAASHWQGQGSDQFQACALSSGEPAIYCAIDDQCLQRMATSEAHLAWLRKLQCRAMLSVPLYCGQQLIGALTLFMGSSGRSYTEAELAFACELAALAAPVVQNARLLAQGRRAEHALRVSEERLRLAVDASQIGIWDWDVATGQVNWSPQVYALHGMVPGQFGGTVAAFAALVHPDDQARIREQVETAISGDALFTAQFRVLRPDGSTGWLSTWGQPYCEGGGGGRCTRIVGATIDVSASMQAQARLERLNTLLEQRAASSDTERDRIWGMSRDILAVGSQDGVLLNLNPAFEAVLGWSPAQALAMPFMELVCPEQRSEAACQLEQLMQGHSVEDYEVRMRHSDGGARWVSWTLVPAGERLYGIGRDVTSLKKQREKILTASEARLQLALDVGGMGAWQWDIRSGEVRWWPSMDVLHGLEQGATIGTTGEYMQLVLPEDRAGLASAIEQAVRARSGHLVEYRVRWPDASVHWVEGRAELTLDEHGEPLLMAGICVDISQRKRTEDDLRFVAQASAELAALGELPDTLDRIAQLAVPSFADWCAVDLLDANGAIDRVAVAHIDPAKVALGHQLFARHPPRPDAPNGIWQVIRSGRAEHIEEISDAILVAAATDADHLETLRALGLRSYIAAPLTVRGKALGVISFVSAEGGRIYGPDDVALAEDIGRRAAIAIENANLYRSLQQADRRKDDFLAMLAHELRNPLAPIRAAADLLKLATNDARLSKVSEVITRQVGHMTGLVDDLLDVSRVTRGHVELDSYAVDMKAVVGAALEQARPLIEAREHKVALLVAAEPLTVQGDEKRLVQIAANLLNNAAKYTPPGGHIELRLAGDAEQVLLTVRDDGIGMSADLVAGAFELFAQAARSSDRSQGGLGLGLALVRTLAELHGGRVKALSKGQGCGSEFVVQLPRLAPVCQAPDPSLALTPGRAQALRVLIVDDNVDAASMLGILLESSGHQVEVWHEPHAALRRAGELQFDVCLLDIGLPDMDGKELARRIRSGAPGQVPVLIAISGYGQAHDRASALEAGFDHYLVKPVGALSLQETLARVGVQLA